MNEPSCLELSTTFFVQRFMGSEIEERDDHWLLRTPELPDFWFGNCLVMKSNPRAGDYSRWQEKFVREFPNVDHRVFMIDDPTEEEGEVRPFTDRGFKLEKTWCLSCSKPTTPEHSNARVDCRPVESDPDWRRLLASRLRTAGARRADEPYLGSDAYLSFIERRLSVYRRMCEHGVAHFWAGWMDGELVGGLGVAVYNGIARFQDVETDPRYRRRGVCQTMLFHLMEWAFEQGGVRTFVIQPVDDSVARVYQRCGFQPFECSKALCRTPDVQAGQAR